MFGSIHLVAVTSFLGARSHTELHLEAAPCPSVAETIEVQGPGGSTELSILVWTVSGVRNLQYEMESCKEVPAGYEM